ncbi:MAG: hypothetical protein QM541_09710 [Flavobacterium sp.]|nr:hypothetical protein [Flavobacterium sp.]
MIDLPNGARRDIGDLQLSRYACYLVIQNAYTTKEVVALEQTYFAILTRKQKIIEYEFNKLITEVEKRMFLRREMVEHNKKLADAAKDAGVI